MARYLISDHHFGHARIIEYTDRPFDSVGDMNQALLSRHYETIGDDDVLIHLGDVAIDMRDGTDTIKFVDRLDANLLVRGNHDVGLDPEEAPFAVTEACVLHHDDREFYCTHRPEDVPDWWDGWAIHDHQHNNDTTTYPFIEGSARRVNVSCELLEYRPLSLATLSEVLDAIRSDAHLRDRQAVREVLDQ